MKKLGLLLLLSAALWGQSISPKAVNNVVYVSPEWNWDAQTPAGSLTGATPATVTLSPCVPGWSSAIYASFNGYMHIDTVGTPEEVLITSATDCSAGSQTVGFTPANSHANGYTIRSSTQGWQEAWNSARFKPPGGSLFNQGGVVRAAAGTSYTWTAPLVVGSGTAGVINNGTVDFTNSIIRCNVGSVSCLQIGDVTNAHPEITAAINIKEFRGEPFVVNGTACMIEDNGEGTKFDGVYARSPSTAGATFGYYACIDDDQAVELSHVSTMPALTGIRCDATFCGAVIKGGNGSAPNATVLWVHDSELSMQCKGNGILNVAGNTLRVANTVIQGYAQYGISSIPGPGPSVLDDVYFEAGSCNNPVFGTPVQVGLITSENASILNGEGPAGTVPSFANTGATKYFYYIVFDDGASHFSTPFLAGTALSNGAGTINVKFYKPTTATNATLLRVSTTAANLHGTGNFLVGTASQALSGACVASLCTMSDTNAALNSYTVRSGTPLGVNLISYLPAMTFWPGDVVLTMPTDSTNTNCCAGTLITMDTTTVTGGSSAGLVSVFGTLYPSFASHMCSTYVNYSPIWMSCLQQVSFGQATTLVTGKANGGLTANFKGRLNLGPRDADVPQHSFTITDVDWDKTMATSGYRPTADAGDTWIGYDSFNGFSTGLALGTGTGTTISNYVGNVGDGTSWLERLSATLKTFTVPVFANPSDNTKVPIMAQCGTGAASNQVCFQVKDQGAVATLTALNDGSVSLGSGSTKSISSGTASNSDMAGTLTLSGGTQTYNFTGTYTSAPICTASDTTAANVVRVQTTTTVLTVTGTGTDVVYYVCFGRN